MNHDGDPWFVYARSAGRISATPASWKGWAVLTGGIAATSAVGWAAMRLSEELHPLLRVLGLTTLIGAGVLLILRVAVAKGRRVR